MLLRHCCAAPSLMRWQVFATLNRTGSVYGWVVGDYPGLSVAAVPSCALHWPALRWHCGILKVNKSACQSTSCSAGACICRRCCCRRCCCCCCSLSVSLALSRPALPYPIPYFPIPYPCVARSSPAQPVSCMDAAKSVRRFAATRISGHLVQSTSIRTLRLRNGGKPLLILMPRHGQKASRLVSTACRVFTLMTRRFPLSKLA